MRILLLGPDIRSVDNVRNFSGVWAYYLSRELRNWGIDVAFDLQFPENPNDYYKKLNLDGIDHIVALGIRYLSKLPRDCGLTLMHRCKGAVTQIYDGTLLDKAPVHCTFTIKNCDNAFPKGSVLERKHRAHNHYIGWASDPDLCFPEQSAAILRILIDHPLYKTGRDSSKKILTNVANFVESGAWKKQYKSVRVRRIIDGGIEDVNLKHLKVPKFNRVHIPYLDICKEYRTTHLFMVTHRESVGLTALETATAGVLPIVPAGMIDQDRLDTIRHVKYEKDIPWEDVLGTINIKESCAVAKQNSWHSVTAKMLAYLERFKK